MWKLHGPNIVEIDREYAAGNIGGNYGANYGEQTMKTAVSTRCENSGNVMNTTVKHYCKTDCG